MSASSSRLCPRRSVPFEEGVVAIQELLQRRALGDLQIRPVLGPAAEPEQVGLGQVRRGEEHSRADRGAQGYVARRVGHDAGDRETGIADQHGVADARVEMDEHGGVNQHATAGGGGPQVRRLGPDRSVEGERAFDRSDLEESREPAARGEDHGADAGDPSDGGARGGGGIEHGADRIRKGPARAQLQVGAEDLPRLCAHCGRDVGAERIDGDEAATPMLTAER
jgi:hypothetical protein